LSKESEVASWREFLLYWIGFVITVIGAVSVLLTFAGVLIDVLSYRCWYPVLSPLMGISQPTKPPEVNGVEMPYYPYYCSDPAIAVIRFVFNLLAELVVIGAGFFMILSGKRR
jgi:hypothetical protein